MIFHETMEVSSKSGTPIDHLSHIDIQIRANHFIHDDAIKWKHFRVTGHLCGEFTGLRWIPRTKASDVELWFFFDLCLNKRLRKQSWAGDLRSYRAHYDVIVMICFCKLYDRISVCMKVVFHARNNFLNTCRHEQFVHKYHIDRREAEDSGSLIFHWTGDDLLSLRFAG